MSDIISMAALLVCILVGLVWIHRIEEAKQERRRRWERLKRYNRASIKQHSRRYGAKYCSVPKQEIKAVHEERSVSPEKRHLGKWQNYAVNSKKLRIRLKYRKRLEAERNEREQRSL